MVAVTVGIDNIRSELKVKVHVPLKRGVGVVVPGDPATGGPKTSLSSCVGGESVEIVVGREAWNCSERSANVAAIVFGGIPGLRIVDENEALQEAPAT